MSMHRQALGEIMSRMKVVMPFKVTHFGINEDKVFGGTEMVCKLMYEVLPKYGIDVIPFEYTSEDSRTRKTQSKLINFIAIEQPDIVIVNFDSASMMKLENFINIPIFYFLHYIGDTIHKRGQIELWEKFRVKNSIYLVSDFQLKSWRHLASNLKLGNIEVDGFLNPTFANYSPYVAKPKVYDAITIGRPDANKNPYWLNTKFKKIDNLKGLIITGSANSDGSLEYTEKREAGGLFCGVIKDLPHKDVLDKLQESKVYISTWANETFGIVGLEALSHGLPVIAVAKDDVCAMQIIPHDQKYLRTVKGGISPTDLTVLINELSQLSDEEREELALKTREKHSEENWALALKSAINATIDKYKDQDDSYNLNSLFG